MNLLYKGSFEFEERRLPESIDREKFIKLLEILRDTGLSNFLVSESELRELLRSVK